MAEKEKREQKNTTIALAEWKKKKNNHVHVILKIFGSRDVRKQSVYVEIFVVVLRIFHNFITRLYPGKICSLGQNLKREPRVRKRKQ
jgi:hypothetical protein